MHRLEVRPKSIRSRRSKDVRAARQRRRRRKRLELTERSGGRTSSDDHDHRRAFGNRRRRSGSIRQAGSIPKYAGRLPRRDRRRRADNLQRKKSGDHEAPPSGIAATPAAMPDRRKGLNPRIPSGSRRLPLPAGRQKSFVTTRGYSSADSGKPVDSKPRGKTPSNWRLVQSS